MLFNRSNDTIVHVCSTCSAASANLQRTANMYKTYSSSLKKQLYSNYNSNYRFFRLQNLSIISYLQKVRLVRPDFKRCILRHFNCFKANNHYRFHGLNWKRFETNNMNCMQAMLRHPFSSCKSSSRKFKSSPRMHWASMCLRLTVVYTLIVNTMSTKRTEI